jgi:hypothetical protein
MHFVCILEHTSQKRCLILVILHPDQCGSFLIISKPLCQLILESIKFIDGCQLIWQIFLIDATLFVENLGNCNVALYGSFKNSLYQVLIL